MQNKKVFIANALLASSILFILSAFTLVEAKPTPRVINGQLDRKNDLSWMAYLYINDKDNNGVRECGGSLIDKEWILTAAHCFLNSSGGKIDLSLGGDVSVLLNSMTLVPVSQGAKIIKSLHVVVHPDFDPATLDFDIALVKLSQPVTLTPISLLSANDLRTPTAGAASVVFGWGATRVNVSNEATDFPNVLLRANQLIVSNEFCENSYNLITSNMMCANGLTPMDISDTCIGDSGGPLVIKQNNTFIQVGITSFGGGGSGVLCGAPDVPGVYTRISRFTDYITQHIPRIKMQEVGVKKSLGACERATVDARSNINIPCVMLNGSAYEAVLDKVSTEGYVWSWSGALASSRCSQNEKACVTVGNNIDLTIKEASGITALLTFEGDTEKKQYRWRFERAFVE
jgi:secreted trypsin-like serine protease